MRYLNLIFILPNNGTLDYADITVKDCTQLLPALFKEHYGLHVTCSRHHIYNIAQRPEKVSKLFKQKVVITMQPTSPTK